MIDRDELQHYIEAFTSEIDRQAAHVTEEFSRQHSPQLSEALRAMGHDGMIALRYLSVWEDPDMQKPPHILAELSIPGSCAALIHEVLVPIAPLHQQGKSEFIFELCMLRAEAHLELRGKCDGLVLQRMQGLAKELGID